MSGTTDRSMFRTSILGLLLPLLFGSSAGAVVGLQVSRSELLYSHELDPDCTELHNTVDSGLPLNVVRLRATVPGIPDDQVVFRWSIQKPAVGGLAADQEISDAAGAPVIEAICAEFGNQCLLTKETLHLYTRPTIFWVAPTCDILPKNTGRQYRGGLVRFRVRATQGRRKLGKASIKVGFGRVASVRLFADGDDGVGKPSGVPTGVRVVYGALTDPGGLALPGSKYTFKDGENETKESEGPCTVEGTSFPACAQFDYGSGGKFLATVEQEFGDGSALCDNVTVQVLACSAAGRLEIIRRPKLRTYVPGDPVKGKVDVTVRLHNDSQARNGLPACGFLISGPVVLRCQERVEFGGTMDEHTTVFDTRHCSVTTDIGCNSNAGCPDGETCLTEAHCSETFSRSCRGDADCQPPACPGCGESETCIKVLDLSSDLVIRPGRFFDLLKLDDVGLFNVTAGKAKLQDLWTAHTINAGDYDGATSYGIKGRPDVHPPRR
ncbi:MAG TPA: hypothetical protein VKA21_11115 [Candidatus Binatia bacterium]|nr:hypothetical protein [Candidatus Binatia bacterium]